MSERTRSLRIIGHTLAVGIVAVLWQLPFFDRWMNPMDEGHILAFADMLAKGGELYRDASLLPLPGAFYLLELAFELFGPSIRLARWIVVFEFALLVVVSFALLRRLVPLSSAWAGVAALLLYRVWAFPHWHMYSYSTTALVALACGLLALVWFLESGRRWVLAVSGLATGLGVLCKQDYGAAGWLAMNLVLILAAISDPRDRRPGLPKLLAWYNVPGMAVGAWLVLHFLRQELFLQMLRQTVLNHLIGITTFEYTSLPPVFPLFEQEPALRGRLGFTVYAPAILSTVAWDRISSTYWYQETILWDLGIKLAFHVPYLVALAAGLRLWRTRGRLRDEDTRRAYLTEMALSIFAIALLASLNKPVDWIHLWVLSWPLVCLLVVYTHALLAGRPRLARAVVVLGVLPSLAFTGYTIQLAWELRTKFSHPMEWARTGISVQRHEARVLRAAVDYVREHSSPAEPFAVLPYFPLVSFLADRPAPHRAAYILWPVEDVPHREQEIVDALEAGPTSHLIYHFTQWVQFPKMAEFAPDLFGYLVDHYEIDRVFPGQCFSDLLAGLKRSPPGPTGLDLLGSGASKASLRRETPGGEPLTLLEHERNRIVAEARMPFRDVLAVRPDACGSRIVLATRVEVPEDAHLRTVFGVDPDEWCNDSSPPTTFEIRASVEGRRTLLSSATLDPWRRPGDRRWVDVDVPLSQFAGQLVDLEFVTGCKGSPGASPVAGGWEPPRLVETGQSP